MWQTIRTRTARLSARGTLKVEEGWRSYEDSLRIWKKAKRQRGGWERATWYAKPGDDTAHTFKLACSYYTLIVDGSTEKLMISLGDAGPNYHHGSGLARGGHPVGQHVGVDAPDGGDQDGEGEVVTGMVLKLKGADSRRVIEGVRARMATTMPIMSPIIWTTLASGYPAETHGVGGWTNGKGRWPRPSVTLHSIPSPCPSAWRSSSPGRPPISCSPSLSSRAFSRRPSSVTTRCTRRASVRCPPCSCWARKRSSKPSGTILSQELRGQLVAAAGEAGQRQRRAEHRTDGGTGLGAAIGIVRGAGGQAGDQAGNARSADADVAAARSELSTAQWTLEQNQELHREGAIPERDVRVAQQAVSAARARLAAAEARRGSSRREVGDTRVVAPVSGVIERRTVNPGEHINRNAALFTLVRGDVLELAAAVPERAAAAVQAGQSVRFTADGAQFTGRVARISPSVDPGSRSVTVYVQVPNPDGRLRAGTFASGRIVSRVVDGALVVPAPAIREGREGGPEVVYRVVDGKVDVVPVTIGLKDEAQGLVQVLDGLAETDQVIVGNVGVLGAGMAVRMAGQGGRGGPGDGAEKGGAARGGAQK